MQIYFPNYYKKLKVKNAFEKDISEREQPPQYKAPNTVNKLSNNINIPLNPLKTSRLTRFIKKSVKLTLKIWLALAILFYILFFIL